MADRIDYEAGDVGVDIILNNRRSMNRQPNITIFEGNHYNTRCAEILDYWKNKLKDWWRYKYDYFVLFILISIMMMLVIVEVQNGTFDETLMNHVSTNNISRESLTNAFTDIDIPNVINKTLKKAIRQWKLEAFDLLLSDYIEMHRMWPRLKIQPNDTSTSSTLMTTPVTTTSMKLTYTLTNKNDTIINVIDFEKGNKEIGGGVLEKENDYDVNTLANEERHQTLQANTTVK